MARGKAAYRKRRQQNRLSMFLVTLIVVMIMVVVAIHSMGIREKIAVKDEELNQLNKQIAAEEQRSEEIAEYGIFTQTKAFFEEVAQDKLGLVYEGEILFKEE